MNRVCSIFSQILQLFPGLEFEVAVRKHQAERHARGFNSWGQFVGMMFCQLGQARSLREICGGLVASEGKPRHLGLPRAPSRSTLALTAADRFLWAWLSRLWADWRAALVIVKPETVIAWHRKGFRLFWAWKARHGQAGRSTV